MKDLLLTIVGFGGVLHFAYPIFAQTWIPTSAPTTNWAGVASSADGSKLAAVVARDNQGNPGPIYTSVDSGATWTQTSAPLMNWTCVASSADGTKLVAGIFQGSLHTSVDSGMNWIDNDSLPFYWSSVASSADGTKLVATTYGVQNNPIYTLDRSSDPGWTWVETSAPYGPWKSVASSADGRRLVAARRTWGEPGIEHSGSIWTSTDSGLTWQFEPAVPLGDWQCVASSADGGRLVAMGVGPVYTSADSGVTWTKATAAPVRDWFAVASSADGTKLVAVASDVRQLFLSTNSGVTWMNAGAPVIQWTSVASSADGSKLVAVAGGVSGVGRIYTRRPAIAPVLSITISGSNALINWPTSSTGFRLQENPDLSSTNWTDLTATPGVTNQQNQVSVSTADGARFYRLKHP